MSDGIDGPAPILEFDPSRTAVIEPGEATRPADVPSHAVLCFFQDVIANVVKEHGGRVVDLARRQRPPLEEGAS